MVRLTAGVTPFYGRCSSGVSTVHIERCLCRISGRGGIVGSRLRCSAKHNGFISHSNMDSFAILHPEVPLYRAEHNDQVIGPIEIAGRVTEDLYNYREAKIKVVGVGGGGSNAVNRMIESFIKDVEFWVVDTGVQAMRASPVCPPQNRLQIGQELTKGFSAGGNPVIGMNAANESRESIEIALSGADIVFITAGMGGGTGTGGAPVIAKIAKSMGILTVGIVTTPFSFEGQKCTVRALEGIAVLRNYVDTLIVIPNDKLLSVVSSNTLLTEALNSADDILRQAVSGISDIITVPGLINVDFADVRTIMINAGSCFMGTGTATGKSRARDAVLNAIQSPLFDIGIEKATGIVWNITGGNDLTLSEVNDAAEVICDLVDPNANLKFGAVIDQSLGGQVSITLIATGFRRHEESKGRQLQIGGENIPTVGILEFLKKIGQSRYPKA